MAIATVTNKGEITIPKEIREYLKLSDGSKINFVIDRDGQVKIIPRSRPGRKFIWNAAPSWYSQSNNRGNGSGNNVGCK